MMRNLRPNKKLTEIIENLGNKKMISVEINPYKQFDLNGLKKINPSFCSVLWIASRNDPDDPKLLAPVTVAKDLVRKGYVVLVHIPTIFYSKGKLRNILLILKEYGIRNIFVMRGAGPLLKIDHCEYPFALDFIQFIKKEFNGYFEIVIAGFPHFHPSTNSMEDEMFFIRRKIEAGASLICTQACLSPLNYFTYRQMCTNFAIDIPIIFGVLMFRSYNDFLRIKRMGSNFDQNIYKKAMEAKKSQQTPQYGRIWTKYIISRLLKHDSTIGVHIYTQNRFELANNILIETDIDEYKAHLEKKHKFS